MLYTEDAFDTMILLMLFGITLSQVGTVAAIAAVIVPAIYWGQRRVVYHIETTLKERSDSIDASTKLHSIENALTELSGKLISHMDSEEKTNQKIQELGVLLFDELRRMNTNISTGQLNTLKAVITGNNQPANLAKVWDGGYEFIWANDQFLNLSGLSMNEFIGPEGVFNSIAPVERELIKQSGEATGQRKEDYIGEYEIINAKTQESRGVWHIHSHFIRGVDDDNWYYLATLRPVDAPAREYARLQHGHANGSMG